MDGSYVEGCPDISISSRNYCTHDELADEKRTTLMINGCCPLKERDAWLQVLVVHESAANYRPSSSAHILPILGVAMGIYG